MARETRLRRCNDVLHHIALDGTRARLPALGNLERATESWRSIGGHGTGNEINGDQDECAAAPEGDGTRLDEW